MHSFLHTEQIISQHGVYKLNKCTIFLSDLFEMQAGQVDPLGKIMDGNIQSQLQL